MTTLAHQNQWDTSLVGPPSDLEKARLPRLVHRWLRPESPWPARRELPFLLGSDPRTTVHVARTDFDLAAHAALHERELLCGEGRLRVGIIGAVATAPECRGRGFASQVIESLIADAHLSDLDLLLLWDEHGGTLYERHGFIEAGVELLFIATRDQFQHRSPPCELRRIDPQRDLEGIAALYRREPGGLLRTRSDWERLAWLPGTDCYVLEDRRTSAILAYGVVGKGSDLSGCLHEWCAPDLLFAPLLSGILSLREEEQLVVMMPPWRHSLQRRPELQEIPLIRGALAKVRVLNPRAIANKLNPHRASAVASNDPQELFGWRDQPAAAMTGPGFYIFGWDSM